MKVSRANLLSLALVGGSFAVAAVLYRRLPDPVPVHWDARGQVNGFMPKPWGVLVLPIVMLGVYLLTMLVPQISPHGFRVERFRRTFDAIQVMLLAFLLFSTLLALLAGAGISIPMVKAVTVGTGVLFVALGNVLGKVTKNFFVGIRTPWALASDEVWLRTHRMGGRVFVLAGLAVVVSGLAGGGVAPLLVAIFTAAFVPIVYSYIIYRRLEDPSRRSPS